MGGRGSSSGKKYNGVGGNNINVLSDRRYEIKSEIVVKKDKHGQFYTVRKSQSEGFKAIYDAPKGTRFTVSYLFGGNSLYEVSMRGDGAKVVQAINEDGSYRRASRYRMIRNVSAVKNLFDNARSITIHQARK